MLCFWCLFTSALQTGLYLALNYMATYCNLQSEDILKALCWRKHCITAWRERIQSFFQYTCNMAMMQNTVHTLLQVINIYYTCVLKATYFVGFRIPVLSSGLILSAPIERKKVRTWSFYNQVTVPADCTTAKIINCASPVLRNRLNCDCLNHSEWWYFWKKSYAWRSTQFSIWQWKRCQQEAGKKKKKSERSKVPGQGLTEGCASEDALQAVAGLAGSERMTTANQSMKTDIQTHTGHTRL